MRRRRGIVGAGAGVHGRIKRTTKETRETEEDGMIERHIGVVATEIVMTNEIRAEVIRESEQTTDTGGNDFVLLNTTNWWDLLVSGIPRLPWISPVVYNCNLGQPG